MFKAIVLLSVIGLSLTQLVGGWHEYYGKIPDNVIQACKDTLAAENMVVQNFVTSNAQTQVVAGTNYKFDATVELAHRTTTCSFTVYLDLSQNAQVTAHTCDKH